MNTEPLMFIDCVRRMPLLMLPIRTTVVPLDGARVLFSPGSTLTEQQLKSAGEVTDIVCPNLIHTEGVPPAIRVHPTARLWGPPGAREKRPDLAWHGILGLDAWPHEETLATLPLGGMPEINEVLFLHRPSRTLLVTDLVFNIDEPKGLGAPLILRIFGTWRRFAVSRLFLKYVKDRAAFHSSVERLAALDFDAVVPAHGAAVASGGKARLLEALRERGFAAP